MLLHGTDFKNPEYRDKFGMKGKYRIVPLNFGEYNNSKVFDYEEVCVQNNDMSFNDYIYLRGYALLVESILNGSPFLEFFKYADYLGESNTKFLRRLYDNINNAPIEVRSIINDFLKETKEELWDTETELLYHYSQDQNYQKLLKGEVGGNLIYKYKSRSVAFTTKEWIDYICIQIKQLLKEKSNSELFFENSLEEINAIEKFCRSKMHGLLDAKSDIGDIVKDFDYDIPGWLSSSQKKVISNFKSKKPIRYRFYYSKEQIYVREDQFKRYGTDVNALAKIVTRISNLESLFRNVSNYNGERIEYIDTSGDQFTRYALSN